MAMKRTLTPLNSLFLILIAAATSRATSIGVDFRFNVFAEFQYSCQCYDPSFKAETIVVKTSFDVPPYSVVAGNPARVVRKRIEGL